MLCSFSPAAEFRHAALTSGRRRRGFPSISNLAARWSAQDSVKTAARDGTGAAPSNAGVIGRILDMSGNGYYLTSSGDSARPTWYADGFDLGRASIHSQDAGHDLFNNTTLAEDVFTGTNPSWTVVLLFARWKEHVGSNQHVWGVLKNGGAIGVGAGNPAFTLTCNNGLYTNLRPILASGYGTDATTALQGGQVFDDDPALGIGYGSSSIICLTRVENVRNSKVYQNGHLVSTVASKTSGDYTFAEGDYVTFGKLFNGTTRTGNLNGHLYEAAVFSKALSDSERQAVERYYLGLLGVQYSSAVVTTPRKLWCFGHSMFIGADATIPTPPYLIARGSHLPWDYKIAIVNQSLGGLQLSEGGATNDQGESLTVKVGTSTNIKPNDIVIHRGITNDVPEYDADEATMDAGLLTESETNLKAFIVAAMTRTTGDGGGVHITDPTIGTGSLTDGLTAGDRAVRRYGLSQWPIYAAKTIGRFDRWEISNSYELLLAGGGDLVLPAIYNSGDGVHLSRAGYDIETAKLATTLRHLIACNPKSHANLVRWYSGRGQASTRADADAMSAIVDLSATGDNAAQATGGNQPTFRLGTSASNYKATIRFDAVDDFASFTAVGLAAWTLIVCVKTNAADARILHDGAGSSGYLRLHDTTTTRVRAGAGNVVRFTHAARTDYDVLVIRSDARMWINGIEATVSDVEDATFDANFVADQLGHSANPFAGELFDVAMYDAELSTADVNQQATYFAYKAGKTWVAVS